MSWEQKSWVKKEEINNNTICREAVVKERRVWKAPWKWHLPCWFPCKMQPTCDAVQVISKSCFDLYDSAKKALSGERRKRRLWRFPWLPSWGGAEELVHRLRRRRVQRSRLWRLLWACICEAPVHQVRSLGMANISGVLQMFCTQEGLPGGCRGPPHHIPHRIHLHVWPQGHGKYIEWGIVWYHKQMFTKAMYIS